MSGGDYGSVEGVQGQGHRMLSRSFTQNERALEQTIGVSIWDKMVYEKQLEKYPHNTLRTARCVKCSLCVSVILAILAIIIGFIIGDREKMEIATAVVHVFNRPVPRVSICPVFGQVATRFHLDEVTQGNYKMEPLSDFRQIREKKRAPPPEDPNDPGTDSEDKMSEPPDPDGGSYFMGPCGGYFRRELDSPVPSGIKRDQKGNMRVGMGLRTFPVPGSENWGCHCVDFPGVGMVDQANGRDHVLLSFTMHTTTNENLTKRELRQAINQQQVAVGFAQGDAMPFEWSYVPIGALSVLRLDSHMIVTGKNLVSAGHSWQEFTGDLRTSIDRHAILKEEDKSTAIVFAHRSYYIQKYSDVAEGFNIFVIIAMCFMILTLINSLALFDFIFPNTVNKKEPPPKEPHWILRKMFGRCCACCLPTDGIDPDHA